MIEWIISNLNNHWVIENSRVPCTRRESRRAKHLVSTSGAEFLQILTFAPKYVFPVVPSGNMKTYVQPSNKIHLFLRGNELHPLRSAGLAQARARRITRHTCRKAQQQTKTCLCRLPPQIYNHKQKFCWKIQKWNWTIVSFDCVFYGLETFLESASNRSQLNNYFHDDKCQVGFCAFAAQDPVSFCNIPL